jgi:hypothetical protein
MNKNLTLEYESMQEGVYEENNKSLKMKKPKKSWKEAKKSSDNKRKGYKKKYNNM